MSLAVPALDTDLTDSRFPAATVAVFVASAQVVFAALMVHVVMLSTAFTRTVLITVSAPPGAIPR